MAVKITVEMLDRARMGHSLMAVSTLREILLAAGIDDVELHPYEIAEIRACRERAENATAQANLLESRGPWPDDAAPA